MGEAQPTVLAAPLAPRSHACGPVRDGCHLLDERFGSSHLSTGMVHASETLVTLGVLVATGVAAIRSTEEPTAIPSETDRPLLEGAADVGGRFPSPERIGYSRRPTPGPGRWRVHRRTRLRHLPCRLERRPHLRSPACATRPYTSLPSSDPSRACGGTSDRPACRTSIWTAVCSQSASWSTLSIPKYDSNDWSCTSLRSLPRIPWPFVEKVKAPFLLARSS